MVFAARSLFVSVTILTSLQLLWRWDPRIYGALSFKELQWLDQIRRYQIWQTGRSHASLCTIIKVHQNYVALDDLLNRLCSPTSTKTKLYVQYWPFVRGIHRWPVDSLHKGSVTREKYPSLDVIMAGQISGPFRGAIRTAFLCALLPWLGEFLNARYRKSCAMFIQSYQLASWLSILSDMAEYYTKTIRLIHTDRDKI